MFTFSNNVFVARLTNNICKSREAMNLNSKASNSGDASVRPLEISELRRFVNTLPSREVLDAWRNADALCFDVDSTVRVDEGIDDLAEFCGARKAVAEWTTSSGEFLGFDANESPSKSGGKATAVQLIRKARGYNSLVMIGDGATDLEARKPGDADLFICYVGVQLRDTVAAKADGLAFNFKELIHTLE